MTEDITIPKRAKIINRELNPEWKVLEVGSSDGRLTRYITNAKEITGLDIDAQAIAEAEKHKNKNTSFIVGDACNLQFEDNSFDVVIAGDIIEHLQDGGKMLSETYRVLKPCGKLIISCPYHGIIKNILISLFNFEGHFNVEQEHIRFYSVKSLAGILERNNFRVIRKYFIGRFPYIWRSMMFIAVKK